MQTNLLGSIKQLSLMISLWVIVIPSVGGVGLNRPQLPSPPDIPDTNTDTGIDIGDGSGNNPSPPSPTNPPAEPTFPGIPSVIIDDYLSCSGENAQNAQEIRCMLEKDMCTDLSDTNCCKEVISNVTSCQASCEGYVFDAEHCLAPPLMNTSPECTEVNALYDFTKTWNCHCSSCAYAIVSEKLEEEFYENGTGILERFQSEFVHALAQVSSFIESSGAILKDINDDLDITLGNNQISILKVKGYEFELLACSQHMPKVLGLDQSFLMGSEICRRDAAQMGEGRSCIQLNDQLSLGTFLANNLDFFQPEKANSDSCALESHIDAFNQVKIVFPMIARLDIHINGLLPELLGEKTVQFGVLVELKIPMSLAFDNTYQINRCGQSAEDPETHLLLVIRPQLSDFSGAALNEFRVKLNEDYHDAIQYYIQLFILELEDQVMLEINDSNAIPQCLNSLASQKTEMSCRAKLHRQSDQKYSIACDPIIIPEVSTCTDLFAKAFKDLIDELPNIALNAATEFSRNLIQ